MLPFTIYDHELAALGTCILHLLNEYVNSGTKHSRYGLCSFFQLRAYKRISAYPPSVAIRLQCQSTDPRTACLLLLNLSSKALEPYISEEIMKLHYTKHHQAYVNGLNAAEEQYAKAQSTKKRIALQSAIKFNGGGASCLFLNGWC
jgi:hypothetical protein